MTTTPEPRQPSAVDSTDENGETLFELFKPRPDDPPNIRYLRFAVVSMGVILLIVFMAVIARLAYLLTRPLPGPGPAPVEISGSAASGATTVAPPQAPLQPEIQLQLPPSARVRSQYLSGNRLSVHYDTPAGEGIMILDLVTGRPLSHVRVLAPKS